MADLDLARRDLSAFADLARRPLADSQVEALQLRRRVTVIVAPRQSGKSRSLAVLALHRAFRRARTRVLIISGGEEAAKRLLFDVRSIANESALLRGSVVDESAGLLTLTNGSEIRSVPASERQIRGWSVDLLLIDEAALVSDDLILGAAFPTTAARPDARIVMASSATTASGAFYDHVALGRQGSEHVEAFAWDLTQAPWIAPGAIASARESMTPTKFAAEYEGVFASGADALFPRALLERATAPYLMPELQALGANAGLGGTDWGVTTDRSALVVVSRAQAPEGMFVIAAAHTWRSGEALDAAEGASEQGVVGQIAALPAEFEQLTMEVNGVGYPLAQALARRIRARHGRECPELVFIHTTAGMKGATYGALRMFMEQGRLVLPEDAVELLRELLLLRVTLAQTGGEKIEAGIGHDDLADALMLASGPYQDRAGAWRSRLGDAIERSPLTVGGDFGAIETVSTGAGIVLPKAPVLTKVGGRGSGSRTQPILGGPSDPHAHGAEPVIHRGGLTLTGRHHLDVGTNGKRVPPSGWTLT
ncbi:MAG TPA: terminase family protein [Solirubrobacteraceae bacterium]|jgi:hypothetical protein|nr:terminase family protein [Solirubrobacteraceae bacterium]